jgi:hypothetical protein
VTFEIFKAFPPDRESAVAELTVSHGNVVDIPAEISRENGELKIFLFGRKEGVAWEYPLDEWLRAIERAVEVLEEPKNE